MTDQKIREENMQKFIWQVYCLTALLAFTAPPVAAGADSASRSFSEEEALHSGKLISVTVITAEDIARCIGCDLPDILEQAGVQIRRHHPTFYRSSDSDRAYASLRGLSDTQFILLVNGVRQEDNMLSEAWWTFVPLKHIERIEIVKGPVSSIHGDGGVGGAAHIFTKKADCEEGKFCASVQTDLSNEAGTGQTFYISGNVRSKGGAGFRLGLQRDESSSREFPEFLDRRAVDPEFSSHYGETALTMDFDHRGDQWLVESSAIFYNNSDDGRPKPSFLSAGGSSLVSIGTTYYMSPQLLFKTAAGYNKERQTFNERTKFAGRRISWRGWGEYHFEFLENGQYTLAIGGEAKREKVRSSPKQVYNPSKRNTRAAFADLEGAHDPLSYQVSVRVDDLSGDIQEQVFTWSGKASYKLGSLKDYDVYLKGSAGTAFRAPGFDEQARRPPSGEALPWKLEDSLTHTAGFRLQKDSQNFMDITVFNTELEHQYIEEDFQRSPGGKALLIPSIHSNEAYMHGIEFERRFKIGSWDGKVFYVYTDTDNTERLRAENPIRHLASAETHYSINPKLTLGTRVMHRGGREFNATGAGGEAVNLMDIQGVYSINDRLRISLAVRNVTDEKYDLHFYTEGPRRTVWLTLELAHF